MMRRHTPVLLLLLTCSSHAWLSTLRGRIAWRRSRREHHLRSSQPPPRSVTGQTSRTCAASAAALLPFEPQPLPRSNRSQWFEGWFVRLVDHDSGASVALILGSLRKRQAAVAVDVTPDSVLSDEAQSESGLVVAQPSRRAEESDFDEHILVLAYERRGRQHEEAVLLPGGEVTLSGAHEAGGGGRGPQMRWWSQQHGGMAVSGDDATIDVTLPGRLRLVANVSGPRVTWSDRSPDREGPEGWLSRTGLLPCHYFVHSFGSPTTYQLSHASARGHPRAAAVAHMERNYGDAFPTGYTWAQASAAGGALSLVVTGGLFVIGPLTTLSYVIGLRAGVHGAAGGGVSPAPLSWNFRTTDLDRIRDARRPCDGTLTLNATSRDGRRRLVLLLAAPPSSFGAALPIPTQGGFSSQPGCRESYVATARVVALSRASRGSHAWEQRLQMTVPRAALEYGGSWQC